MISGRLGKLNAFLTYSIHLWWVYQDVAPFIVSHCKSRTCIGVDLIMPMLIFVLALFILLENYF